MTSYASIAKIRNHPLHFALAAIVASLLLSLLLSKSALAQDPSEVAVAYYRIYPKCNEGIEREIRYAMDKPVRPKPTGLIGGQNKKAIKVEYLTNASIVDDKGPIVDHSDFNEFIRRQRGKFALTIDPGQGRQVMFTLTDLGNTGQSYKWDGVPVNVTDDRQLILTKDRLDNVAKRIKSIISGEPYRFVFTCFIYDGPNENIRSFSNNLPRNLADNLRDKLIKKNYHIKYKIDSDYKVLEHKECEDYREQFAQHRCLREYDCIIQGKIAAPGNSLKITMHYSTGGESKWMTEVSGRQNSDILDKLTENILTQLPEIIGN